MFLGDDPEGPHPRREAWRMRPLSFPGLSRRPPAAVPAKLTRNGRSLNAARTEAGGYRPEGAGLRERCSASSLEEPPTH